MENIANMGFKKPTPVQMQTIPSLIDDRNVLVTAPTGTGKTISYLLPIVHNLMRKRAQKEQKTNKKNKVKPSNKKQQNKLSKFDSI